MSSPVCAECDDDTAESHNMVVTRPGHPIGPHKWLCPDCAVELTDGLVYADGDRE